MAVGNPRRVSKPTVLGYPVSARVNGCFTMPLACFDTGYPAGVEPHTISDPFFPDMSYKIRTRSDFVLQSIFLRRGQGVERSKTHCYGHPYGTSEVFAKIRFLLMIFSMCINSIFVRRFFSNTQHDPASLFSKGQLHPRCEAHG